MLIEIMKLDERIPVYHRADSKALKKLRIDKEFWEEYLYIRDAFMDINQQMKLRFTPFKDKPMRVEKNHVIIKENEIHHFDEDGTITIHSR